MDHVKHSKTSSNANVEVHHHGIPHNQSHANQPVSPTVRGYVLDGETDNIRNLYTFCHMPRSRGNWDICLHKETKDYYACKSFFRDSITENVQRQIKIMHRLAGQQNIGIKAVYEDHLGVHIVMMAYTGRSLLDVIEGKKCFSEVDAAKLIKTILKVIDLCHSHGVIIGKDLWRTFVFTNRNNLSLRAVYFGRAVIFQPDDLVEGETNKLLRKDIKKAGRTLCWLLTGGPPSSAVSSANISDKATQLIEYMIHGRLTAHEALFHPWFHQNPEEAFYNAVPSLEAFIGTLERMRIEE